MSGGLTPGGTEEEHADSSVYFESDARGGGMGNGILTSTLTGG